MQSKFAVADGMLEILLKIIHLFLNLISKTLQLTPLQSFITSFPKSLHLARKAIGLDDCSFVKYVCCPDCSSIYPPDECIKTTNDGRQESERCSFVQFPNHTQFRFRQPCGAELMKSFSSIDGKKNYLYPKKLVVVIVFFH